MSFSHLLLKAKDIDGLTGERKTHFLNANAVRINKSLGDKIGLSQIGVHLIYVEPGRDSSEYHKHYYEEECIYVLSGCGTLTMDGVDYKFDKGDFAGFPRDSAAHCITNTGTETLVCLVIGQRLQQDVSDYPNKKKRLYRNSGEWNLVDFEQIINPHQ